jgi:hypothetical protein
MHIRHPLAIGVILVLVVAAGLVLAVRIYMGRPAEDRLQPEERVAIPVLREPLPDNAFLACPAGYCAVADAMPSPVFAFSADRLAEYWTELMGGELRLVVLSTEPQQRRLVLLQHSRVLRFPDLVTVEFVPLGPERSSLALYSRARYGIYDFGTNRRRVGRWLSRLQQIARPAPAG